MKIFMIILFIVLSFSLTKNAYSRSSLSYEKFYRVNTPSDTAQTEDWFGLSFNEGYESKDKSIKAKFDIDFLYFPRGVAPFNFSLGQAYIQTRTQVRTGIWGRKIVNWSPFEKYWSLGQLNGNQSFKLLSDKQEGLLGYHSKWKVTEEIALHLFVSYLHIPAMNPQVTIENGKALSNSEWMRKPPTQTVISDNAVKDIYYQINDPNISDIVINKSLGLNFIYKDFGFTFNNFAIYKPESKIRVNAEAVFDPAGDRVIVTANPIVNHHVVMGSNIQYKIESFRFGIGYQMSDPNAKLGSDFNVLDPVKLQKEHRTYSSEYLKIEPNYEKESYLMARAKYSNLNLLCEINYIKLLSSNERGSDDFFSETVKWKSALGAKVRYRVTDEVIFGADYKFDIIRLDQILKLTSSFQVTKDISIMIGGELLKAPEPNSFWSVYRANDSFYSKFKYSF